MTHFTLEDWADYLRGLVDGTRLADMHVHAQSCMTCANDMRQLRLVATTLVEDAGLQLESGVLQRAYALSARLPAAPDPPLRRLLARLAFDAGTQPALAGVRSGASRMRQMVFEAERYQVHLQWELAAPGGSVAMVGRVSATPDMPLPPGIVVRAINAGAVAGEATTNQFGEFVLECPWGPSLTLLLPLVGAGVRIEVPLASVSTDSGRKKP